VKQHNFVGAGNVGRTGVSMKIKVLSSISSNLMASRDDQMVLCERYRASDSPTSIKQLHSSVLKRERDMPYGW
jgi:hypothetical protein